MIRKKDQATLTIPSLKKTTKSVTLQVETVPADA